MQQIHVTGRVGGDAETRQAGSGNVTNFNCAVDQGWGDNKQTNWYRVAIWGERGGKLAPYILKGKKVAVTGELVIGEYQGKAQYEIRANDVDPFMSDSRDGSQGAPAQPSSNPQAFDVDLDDSVPFLVGNASLERRVS